MISKVKPGSESTLLDYIGSDYQQCAYLYANLAKYGLSNINMSMWTIESDGSVLAIIQKYFSCMHLYSKSDGWLSDELLNLIDREAPRTMFASQDNAKKLLSTLINRHYMTTMNVYSLPVEAQAILEIDSSEFVNELQEAKALDIDDITDFLMKDEEYRKNYERMTLYDQLTERLDDKYSRYYIIRKNNEIIASVSTKAEHPLFAVVGGVMVKKDYRGRNIGKCITYDITKILQAEGKELLSLVSENNIASTLMFTQVGYDLVGSIGKLTAL
ncbi:MAG: FR47-like protein [Firmicutes bacterium ADurb.Bin419]|nr:MAG: FR47-like protein [Firmicutes bacterium ADurb.Bin419]